MPAVVLSLLLIPAWAGRVSAHVTSTSYSSIEIGRRQAALHLILNPNLLTAAARWDLNRDGKIDRVEAAAGLDAIRTLIESEYFLRVNGFVRPPLALVSQRVGEDGSVVLDYTATLPEPTEFLEPHVALDRIAGQHHQHLMRVSAGGETAQYAFDADVHEVRIDPGHLGAGLTRRIVEFVKLGILHILTGYDHLLFLTGLIVATLQIGQLVRVVTSFTIAHSITLVLATLGVVILPARFVESAIALTIAYVAVENLWIKSFDRRWRLTFFFGLVHGFGFASVLRQIALPPRVLAASLLSFNVGVELGQLGFVLLLFPLVVWTARTKYYRSAVATVSAIVLAFGAYWFVIRLVA